MDEPPKKQTRTRRKTNYKGAENKKTSGILPKTDRQKELLDALSSSRQVFILGPAGTGKTYVTATYAYLCTCRCKHIDVHIYTLSSCNW